VLKIDVLTLFPGMFAGPFDESIVKRARESGALELGLVDIRKFATDRHRTTDDTAYGGGPGMVMKPEPLFAAVESVRSAASRVILLSPQGRLFKQAIALELSELSHLILLCGHYEGVDERVREHLIDEEISIGDYVLTGGELAAMVLVDAVTRLLPGVLGSDESLLEESHSSGLLEYPQYTRPAEFRGWTVPDVLLSGNHAEIARWRRRQALERTLERRPDLVRPEHIAELEALKQPKRSRRQRLAEEARSPRTQPSSSSADGADAAAEELRR
jgi:tRNA (guanine37-N1)-methyltransferase